MIAQQCASSLSASGNFIPVENKGVLEVCRRGSLSVAYSYSRVGAVITDKWSPRPRGREIYYIWCAL